MKTVKFNYNYSKLHNQKSGFLVWVDVVHMSETFPNEETYLYDTDGKYEFELKKDYLQLVFLGDKDIPFTTYRDDNFENRIKYVGHVGEVFEFEVIEDGEQ